MIHHLQVETVQTQEAFKNIKEFFVCAVCGKVYWEGSHWDRVCEQFDNILKLNPAGAAGGDAEDDSLLYEEDDYDYDDHGAFSADRGGWS